jgi:hypothetical protein
VGHVTVRATTEAALDEKLTEVAQRVCPELVDRLPLHR